MGTEGWYNDEADPSIDLLRRDGFDPVAFAYPFGAYDKDALHYVHFAGYSAAMGLGNDTLQGNKNLFYLYRMVVNGNQNLESFALPLPWRGDVTNLTALTLVP